MKHLPSKLDPCSCFTNQSFDVVVTASGKMRTADYTTGKWLVLGLRLRLGFGLRLWFRLGFCQYPHAYCLSTVRPATPQSAFYQWPVVEPYDTNCWFIRPTSGVTTAPADPAMQGGPRTQGAQSGSPKIFSDSALYCSVRHCSFKCFMTLHCLSNTVSYTHLTLPTIYSV